ncbi:MAG: uracil-DNA glycosylase [Spirochaetia bacterium]|nr:uracil-DNA glycosylase [Spirochaetia bacterium]
MNTYNTSINLQETPDFSAVIHSILRDSGVLERIEAEDLPESNIKDENPDGSEVEEADYNTDLELNADSASGHAPLNDSSDYEYAASCRNLADITWKVNECTLCGLCETRTHAVPGNGVMNPKVMVIGEAPGAQEDKTGEPFVGPAGKYLDTWMGALKLFRGRDLFIGNIIKCRPPGNRDPFPDETDACLPYLKRQIQIIKPRTILCVGRIAAQILTGDSAGIGRLRTSQYTYEGIPMIVTYHPSAVLRNPEEYRKPVWEDLQKLLKLIY